MLISLGIIIAIYALVQFGLLGVVGAHNTDPFFSIVPKLTANPVLIKLSNFVIKIAILSSYLGGFYGMFYANSWHLYAIAKEKKILFAQALTKLNRYQTPWVSVLLQAILILMLLVAASTSVTTLMTMSGFGVVIAYILSTISYLVVVKKKRLTGAFAFGASALLLVFCLNDLATDGFRYLLPFVGMLGGGLVLYRR